MKASLLSWFRRAGSPRLRGSPAGRGLFLAAGLLALPSLAHAVEVTCRNGDALGWSVSTAGDFDGDGVTDIAAGAPCATVDGKNRAGRAYVYSGDTGARLLSLEGTEAGQLLGAALSFLDDLDGDGADELAVGSSGFDAPKAGGGTFSDAGKLDVHSSQGGVLWTLFGTNPQASLGEAVDALADIDNDTVGDVVVGASGASTDGSRNGIGYLVSGIDGSVIGASAGTLKSDAWANVVAGVGDMDGDGHDDIGIAASNAEFVAGDGGPAGTTTTLAETTTTLDSSTTTTSTTTTSTTTLRDAGIVQILSGAFPYDEITRLHGVERQRLGRSLHGTPDVDGDQLDELWLGSPGAVWLSGGLADAGKITLHRSATPDLNIFEPTPQSGAQFGTSLAVIGNVNGDAVADVAAAAPTANVNGGVQTGRVHAFSGTGVPLAPLWTKEGPVSGARMGQSLDGGIFYDGDSVPDLVVGLPGDAPNGRRNAGSVRVLSGANGNTLAKFSGRRGGESRLFVAGRAITRRPLVQSFDLRGRRREADISPFRSQRSASLSLAVIDDAISTGPSDMFLAIGTGPGGSSNRVLVYRAGRRRSRVGSFLAGPAGYTGGVNVGAGNLFLDKGVTELNADVQDEIAVVPADATAGNIDVVIYRREDTEQPVGRSVWGQVHLFRAYSAADKNGADLINAVGANVVAGNVRTSSADPKDEIIVAPAAGLPVVRIFSRSGTLRKTFEAFTKIGTDELPNSGVALAVGNIDGDTNNTQEIVTVVADGQLRVKAFSGDGVPALQSSGGPAVNFTISSYPASYRGGLRVAVADVDFDGAGEILVAPARQLAGPILAFERDGSAVAGWKPFFPLGPSANMGLSLATTDSFVRR